MHILASSLQELLTSHSFSPKEARRLRGRMQFAHGQLSGRYHSRCLSSLHELSALAPGLRAPVACEDFTALFASLVNSMPRAVSSKDRLVWHLFTDGALEASKPSRRRPRGLLWAFPLSLFIRAPSSFSTYNIWILLHFAPRDPSHFGGISPLARPALRHGHFLSCGQRSCTSFSHSHVMRQPCGRPACSTPTP